MAQQSPPPGSWGNFFVVKIAKCTCQNYKKDHASFFINRVFFLQPVVLVFVFAFEFWFGYGIVDGPTMIFSLVPQFSLQPFEAGGHTGTPPFHYLSMKINLFQSPKSSFKGWRAFSEWELFQARFGLFFTKILCDARLPLPYLTLNICSHFEKQVLFIQTGWRNVIWLVVFGIRYIYIRYIYISYHVLAEICCVEFKSYLTFGQTSWGIFCCLKCLLLEFRQCCESDWKCEKHLSC